MNIKWTEGDALVLQAVRLATKDNSGATISRLLRVGDFINRDIFDLKTLSASLTKLCQTDLVYCDNEKFYLNEQYELIFESECKAKQLFKNTDQLYNIMKTLDLEPNTVINIDFLNKDYYDNAYKEYSDSFQ
jgi:hypothetical protein